MKIRPRILALALTLAAAPAFADTFNLSQLTNAAIPSTRGSANTTWFGWESWDDPGTGNPINDATPDIGTDPGGVSFQTVNGENHRASSGNLYHPTTGSTLHERVTVATSGTVGSVGTTTIIAQFLTSLPGDFPGQLTLSSINGVLPTVVRGINGAGSGQVWAKWVIPGNEATYSFVVLGATETPHYSMTRMVIDTHWDATTPQPDTMVPFTTFTMDQSPDVVAPSFRGNTNTTFFGWETWDEQGTSAPINDSTPDIGTNPGGANFQTTNGEDHIAGSGNYYTSSGSPAEQVTVPTSGTVGSSGTTTIIAQLTAAGINNFPTPLVFSDINGVAPTVVSGHASNGGPTMWVKWIIPGNQALYTFTITGGPAGGFSAPHNMDRLIVDTAYSAVGPMRDVMQVSTPAQAFAMNQSPDVVKPSFRGNINTTFFGWETWDEQGTSAPINDSTPDIGTNPGGANFQTTNGEDHIAGSGNYYTSSGSPAEQVTVPTSGTVGSSGTTTIIAQLTAAGINNFPTPLVFSDINGVAPTVVSGHASNGGPTMWVKWIIPGNQALYTFTITGGPAGGFSAPHNFDRLIVDTKYQRVASPADTMQATTPGTTYVMNDLTGAVTPSTRGSVYSTWFGWGAFNDANNRADPTTINDSTPDIGTTSTGANFQTTNGQDHLLASGNIYFLSGTLAEEITVPTNGVVGSDGTTTIILQMLTAPGSAGMNGFADLIGLGAINGVSPVINVQGLNNGNLGHLWAKWVVPGNQASYTIPISGPSGQAHFSIDRVVVDTVWLRNGTQDDIMTSAEILVESPVGTEIEVDDTVSYGVVPNYTTVTRTFTIINTGTADLSGIVATLDGANAADFNIAAHPATTLAPSVTTTVVVEFDPDTAPGTKNAELLIVSNDTSENPYDILLTGTSSPNAGTLAINLPTGSVIEVNEEADTVDIPIIRSVGLDGDVSVTIATVNGVGAGGATAGTDFTPPSNTVLLGDGVTSLDVPITILDPANTGTESNEVFTVNLSGDSLTPGGTASVTVRIIDSVDSTLPAIPVISAPLANQVLNLPTGAPLDITGTATDNKGVAVVDVQLNGGAFVPATLTATGTTPTTWTRTVTPLTGTNTIAVRSTDTRGNNSVVATRAFKVQRPLTVSVGADPSHGTLTAGFAGSTFREVGKSYTITATPKAPTTSFDGTIFTGWTLGGQDVANGNAPFTPQRLGLASSSLEKQTLTFIFREGLTLTANFIENPFKPMAGTYYGLVRPSDTLPDRAPLGAGTEDGTTRTNASEGHFKGTVQNTGAFSGTLTIDGLTLNFAGAFDHAGHARFGTARTTTITVARPKKPSLMVALQIDLDTPGTNDAISGTVTAREFQQSVTSAVSVIESDRAYYNGTSLIVPAAYLGAANATGTFTTVYPAQPVGDQPAGFTELDYPQGHGVGSITISKSGMVTITGTLSDGTGITASSALSQTNRFPLFAQLYAKLGFLSGFVQLDDSQPDSDMAATDLKWLRPFQGTSHYYPYGWPEVINVDLMGAKYVVAAGQSVLKAANGVNLQAADEDGNVALSFSDGQLSEALNKAANLSAADAVIKVPSNDPTFTMLVNRTTGMITGTLTHTDDTLPSYNAVIFQKGPGAGAYGYFLTKQPLPINYTGESGSVTIFGQP